MAQAAGELRSQASSSARADELLAQAEELEEHEAFMDPATFSAAALKQMRYSSRSYQRKRGKGPGE